MGTVRFLNDEPGTSGYKLKQSSTSSIGTQSDPINYSNNGTDPLKLPERGTQTDTEYLLWNRSAANSLKISSNLVDMLINEMENIIKELPFFQAYERAVWGKTFQEERGRQIINLQLLREIELTKAEGLSPTSQPFSIRCGLGSRVVVLFAEPEHDSYCTEHIGHLVLILRRRQFNWIQLPTCPSDAIFGRQGEIIIIGLYNGEFLLLSALEGKIGQVLWSGGGPTAGLHTRAITQFKWMDEPKGILLSIGLDGKVIQSRLEPNNQLKLIQFTQITLSDLPKYLYKDKLVESTNNRSVGLVGISIFFNWENKRELWIATETGVLIKLNETLNDKKYSFELSENEGLGIEGIIIEQFLTVLLNEFKRIFIWSTLDGKIIQKYKLEEGQQFKFEEQKILPIGRCKREFIIFNDKTNNILFTLSTQQKQKINKRNSEKSDLIAWDLLKGELLLRDVQIGQHLEAIALDTGNVMIGISNREEERLKKNYFLSFYEVVFK